jgi:hypothetical protein
VRGSGEAGALHGGGVSIERVLHDIGVDVVSAGGID